MDSKNEKGVDNHTYHVDFRGQNDRFPEGDDGGRLADFALCVPLLQIFEAALQMHLVVCSCGYGCE